MYGVRDRNRFWTIGGGAVAKVDKNLPARALSLFLQLTWLRMPAACGGSGNITGLTPVQRICHCVQRAYPVAALQSGYPFWLLEAMLQCCFESVAEKMAEPETLTEFQFEKCSMTAYCKQERKHIWKNFFRWGSLLLLMGYTAK